MKVWSEQFVALTGAWGVGLGFLLPDALTLPIPPDAFLVAGYLGNLSFWEILVWASGGSIIGGTLGFLMIRALSEKPRVRRWLDTKISKGKVFMDRYGLYALALGALTPLPYSMICWACGAMRIRLAPFLAVSLLRIPRVAVYLLIIQHNM